MLVIAGCMGAERGGRQQLQLQSQLLQSSQSPHESQQPAAAQIATRLITARGGLLSGDTQVQADVASTVAAAMTPGTAVQLALPPVPVLVTPREQ